MASYTITITPEGGGDGTTTTLRLDVTRGVATLTDVHLHAGAGLSAGQLPTIDYAMLLRAVGQEGAPAKAAAARKATGRGRPPAKRAGRAAAAEPVKATRARVAAKKTARGAGGGRAYRRMPDDLATVYQKVGGATAVSEHYGVPRHTVQGWLRRLRSQGILPSG